MRFILLFFIAAQSLIAFAQPASTEDSRDSVFTRCKLLDNPGFTYRLEAQEYITNENDFFLDVTNDTQYLHFIRTGPLQFDMHYSADEAGKHTLKTTDSLRKMHYKLRFSPAGKVVELVNWEDFRDVIISGLSAQVRAGLLTSSDFQDRIKVINKENIMRRIAMEDINYLFALYGDTVIVDAEYIRVKPVRSPFTGEDVYITGNMKVEKPPGTKNTILMNAKNQAGPAEKPLLLQDCKEYRKQNAPEDQPLTEITSVGLNSEQAYQYNRAQQQMVKVTFSDVLAINMQSRGNIRIYTLWDIKDKK
ncbi:MAG: hypothetical protein JNL57_08440 [Bacteroidetes bacterium]|nr:hypothetical protein [Bacteroidota bacterium]